MLDGRNGKGCILQADSKYTDEVQEKYQNINREVLILWGKEDTWIPIEKGRILESLIPNSKLITIPQAGHSFIF